MRSGDEHEKSFITWGPGYKQRDKNLFWPICPHKHYDCGSVYYVVECTNKVAQKTFKFEGYSPNNTVSAVTSMITMRMNQYW